MGAMSVGKSKSIRIARPEILGDATMVVENVARIRNTISLSQLLLSLWGHFNERPKNLLL